MDPQWRIAARASDIVVFAGHHDGHSPDVATRLRVRERMSNLAHPLVYLSAHTHTGFRAPHRAIDRRPLLEMNVSSLSDWPIAYRRIHFAWDEKATRLLVRADPMPRGERPVESYADLLAAREAQTCGRQTTAGERIREADHQLVRRQREARGSIVDWLLHGLGPTCDECDPALYEHAQAYQDAMLDMLVQTGTHLQESRQLDLDLPALLRREAPRWCVGESFGQCVADLQAQKPTNARAHMQLFRRKAEQRYSWCQACSATVSTTSRCPSATACCAPVSAA